jgi:hypothetical protein
MAGRLSGRIGGVPPTVQAVGVLTLVHGAIIALVGVLLVVTAPLQLLEGEELPVVIFGVILGLAWAVVGAGQLACGAQVLRRRWRAPTLILNLVAMAVTLPLCCGLSFGLGVLSFVVLGQPDAVRWFGEAEV